MSRAEAGWMPSHRSLYAVLLSACATTGTLVDHQSAQTARVTLAPLTADETTQVIPRAIDPRLPTADRLSHVIGAELGDRASVDVRLCVSPQGRVVEAKLERASKLSEFNDAVMTDVQAWQFAAHPGPDSLRTCESATIVYRLHR